MQIELYQSVLQKLSLIPVEYLPQVDFFLSNLAKKVDDKEQSRKAIMALTGGPWTDWSEEDFQDFLKVTKETGSELFNREIEL